MRNAITIGRLAGIRVDVNLSWLAMFGLITYSLGAVYFPRGHPGWSSELAWAVGLAASVLFFACVVLHELAHSLTATHFGIPVRGITLFVLGGVSRIGREPPTATVELRIALAGPLASLLLALVFALLWVAAGRLERTFAEPLRALFFWLAGVNAGLAIFNLLPGFPLDGGRVLRSLVWLASDDSP